MRSLKILFFILGISISAVGLASAKVDAKTDNKKVVVTTNIKTDPAGFWQTIDHPTGRVSSIIHFSQQPDGTYVGKLYKGFPIPGEYSSPTCDKCKGELKGKPMLGLPIVIGMQPDPNQDNKWIRGQVLDPRDGKIYNAQMTLSDNGQQLLLRGYIGMPMLGQTETWYRTSTPESSKKVPGAK